MTSIFKSTAYYVNLILLFVIIFMVQSCSTEQQKYLFRYNYEPLGRTIKAVEKTWAKGTALRNGMPFDDINWIVAGELILKTIEKLENNSYMLDQQYNWNYLDSIDQELGDSLINEQFLIHMTDRDSMVDFEIPSRKLPVELKEYSKAVESHFGLYFPDEPIAPGFKWKRIVPAKRLDGSVVSSKYEYIFKGFTEKNGYKCAIFEINADIFAVVPPNPEDTLRIQREEWREVKGMQYFSLEHQYVVQMDYKIDIVSHRKMYGVVKYHIDEKGNRTEIPENERKPSDVFFNLEYEQVTNLVFSGFDSN